MIKKIFQNLKSKILLPTFDGVIYLGTVALILYLVYWTATGMIASCNSGIVS